MILAIMLFVTVYILPPPARYDHAYHGRLTVINADGATLNVICRRPAIACSVVSRHNCLIVMPRITNYRRQIYRHELAHCNGWPANHPM
jgi:hypothetical protein